jgi:hypothetical protein
LPDLNLIAIPGGIADHFDHGDHTLIIEGASNPIVDVRKALSFGILDF